MNTLKETFYGFIAWLALFCVCALIYTGAVTWLVTNALGAFK